MRYRCLILKVYPALQKLRGQLYSQRIDINIKNRKGGEPIGKIKSAWTDYKKRPIVNGLEALSDLEDRADEVSDIDEAIAEEGDGRAGVSGDGLAGRGVGDDGDLLGFEIEESAPGDIEFFDEVADMAAC